MMVAGLEEYPGLLGVVLSAYGDGPLFLFDVCKEALDSVILGGIYRRWHTWLKFAKAKVAI
jgi:hypothetical protein